MDTDDWKEFRKQGERIKANRLKRHHKAIDSFCRNRADLSYTMLTEWQIRISGHNSHTQHSTVLDIFPKGKRYHNLTADKRGAYHNLIGFLKSVFPTK